MISILTTIRSPLILIFAEFSKLPESPFHLGECLMVGDKENLMGMDPYMCMKELFRHREKQVSCIIE